MGLSYLFACLLFAEREKGKKRLKNANVYLYESQTAWPGDWESYISSDWSIKTRTKIFALGIRPSPAIKCKGKGCSPPTMPDPRLMDDGTLGGTALGGYDLPAFPIQTISTPWASGGVFSFFDPGQEMNPQVLVVPTDFSHPLLPGFRSSSLGTICCWQETDFVRGSGKSAPKGN